MMNRFIFFLARHFNSYPKGQEYGLKLFHWYMPYGENAGFEISFHSTTTDNPQKASGVHVTNRGGVVKLKQPAVYGEPGNVVRAQPKFLRNIDEVPEVPEE